MTWLWTALIVIGLAMIAVAVWPSVRGRGKDEPSVEPTEDDQKPEGV